MLRTQRPHSAQCMGMRQVRNVDVGVEFIRRQEVQKADEEFTHTSIGRILKEHKVSTHCEKNTVLDRRLKVKYLA